MNIIKTNRLSTHQNKQIYQLWNSEYPNGLNYNSPELFEKRFNELNSARHYLLLDEYGGLLGWCCDFEREQERWFSIIVDPNFHTQGYGTILLNMLKENNEVLNGWVVDHNNHFRSDGEHYYSPLPFYLKNHFEVLSDIRMESELLSVVKIKWSKNY